MDREEILKHKELAEDLALAFEAQGRNEAVALRSLLAKAEAASGPLSLETDEEDVANRIINMARPVIVENISFEERKAVCEVAEALLSKAPSKGSPMVRALRQLVIDMRSSTHPDEVELTDSRSMAALMMLPGVEIAKGEEVVH
jgi:hypothetical protein